MFVYKLYGRIYTNFKICKCLVSNLTNMSNFQPLEVVGRASETELQVGENLTYWKRVEKIC